MSDTPPTVEIVVASTRRPKLDAVRDALDVLWPKLCPEMALPGSRFEIVAREVPSGVRETPLSRAESMAGARNRAEALVQIARQENLAWRYFVGLEGGLDVIEQNSRRVAFLTSWAYVTDGSGRGAFGQSGAIALPDALAREVLDNGASLSAAIDAFAARSGVRDAEGAWGVLTAGLITRRDSFRIGVINAFAPFFNAGMYASGDARAQRGSA
ncbi:MAG: inosine/xanthosine triphosphatase [Candidatus Acidiferrales bacterium]